MGYVIIFEGMAGPVTHPDPTVHQGDYLKAYDPDAHEGRGFVLWSRKVEDALVFASAPEAMEFWRQPSTVRPLRPDGKPNRPLTAITISVERVKEE